MDVFLKPWHEITRVDVINQLSEGIYSKARAVYEGMGLDIDTPSYEPGYDELMLTLGYSLQTIKILRLFDQIRNRWLADRPHDWLEGRAPNQEDFADYPGAYEFFNTYLHTYATATRTINLRPATGEGE